VLFQLAYGSSITHRSLHDQIVFVSKLPIKPARGFHAWEMMMLGLSLHLQRTPKIGNLGWDFKS
jgi:hypothetical protein